MKSQINIEHQSYYIWCLGNVFFDSARLVNFRSLMKHSDEPWNALICERFGQFSIFEIPMLSPLWSEMCKVFITLQCFSVSLIHRLYCTFFIIFQSFLIDFRFISCFAKPFLMINHWMMQAMHVLHFVICVWLELIEVISSHPKVLPIPSRLLVSRRPF